MKPILRVLALALLLTLVFSVPAQAAANGMDISFEGPITLTKGKSVKALTTKIRAAADGTVVYTLTDTAKKTVVYTETRTGVKAGQEIKWPVPYDDTNLTAKKPVKQIRASFLLDGNTYTFSLYYTYSEKDGTVTVEQGVWYPENTACSFGPAFRDVRPALTSKWYLFTPIDLTIQGRQTFEYIASNLYLIGEVYVDVYGDSVRVTYHNFYDGYGGNTTTLTEFYTFFHDLKSVTNVEPETMGDPGFCFGQEISIAEDLDGDTNVLLFVRNRVTYRDYVTDSHKLTRFWPNLKERRDLRNQMMDMMNR